MDFKATTKLAEEYNLMIKILITLISASLMLTFGLLMLLNIVLKKSSLMLR
jgi:hypothetical protein